MKKKIEIFLLSVIVLSFQGALAQNQRGVDSLNAVLQTKAGGDRFSPLYELTFQYMDHDNQKALVFIEGAHEAALLSGDSLWIVKAKRVMGQVLYKLERTLEAIPPLSEANAIAGRNRFDKEQMMLCNTLGICYLSRAQYDRALDYLVRALQRAEEQSNRDYIILSLNNIGVTYCDLQDYEKALTYLLRSLGLRDFKAEVDWDVVVNISLCYSHLEEFSKAQQYLEKLEHKTAGIKYSDRALMHIKFIHGYLLYRLGKFDIAIPQFQSSLLLAKRIHHRRMIMDNIIPISDILISENALQDAHAYLKLGESMIDRGAPFPSEIIEVYSHFADLYRRKGNYKALALYQSRYIQLKDSIFSTKLTTRLMTAEAEFKERENKERIASQDQIISLNDAIMHRQKVLNIITVLLAAVTLAFAALLFVNFRRKQHLNKLLEQKVRERTQELEHSRDQMLRVIKEKNLRMKQVSVAIVDSINSIEGLCLTGRKEIAHPLTHSYLQRIKDTSSAIAGCVQEFLSDGVLQHVP